jgi:hypothetical protein
MNYKEYQEALHSILLERRINMFFLGLIIGISVAIGFLLSDEITNCEYNKDDNK